jgi:REP element-mobilizing transposase RayT
MTYDPKKHDRQSIRLPGYDYRQAGAYYVTVCVQDRRSLFGEIVDGTMRCTDAGAMICDTWHALPDHYPGVSLDAFVAMPNHVHGVIVLTGDGRPPGNDAGQPRGDAPAGAAGLSLPEVVHRFKSLTTARYRHGVYERGWPPFPGRLWQRNYWDHIVRGRSDLERIRRYIADNPARWHRDRLHT